MTTRSMPVPEGLAGMRVDAGLARLLGLSRTVVAALAEEGGVEVDGALDEAEVLLEIAVDAAERRGELALDEGGLVVGRGVVGVEHLEELRQLEHELVEEDDVLQRGWWRR